MDSTVVMEDIFFRHPYCHCPQTLQLSKPHQPPHSGSGGMQRPYWMFKCVPACLSDCILLKWVCTRLLHRLLNAPLRSSASKSGGSNSLLWLTQMVNNTINPPFRPRIPYSRCMDYHISTSGARGHGCATTNRHGGDCHFCGCLSGRNLFVSLAGLLRIF